MTGFDKFCACFSIGIGAIFMALGAIGLFLGSSANFTLPPVLGGLPFLLGWGMCVPLIKFWSRSAPARRRIGHQAGSVASPVFKMPEMPAGE